MPPKRKNLLGSKPKGKAKVQELQSENDFLEAADDFEQAAGKWRAGDAAKASRFFNRAIDTYSEGLKRYPRSFDLAYNKANLEYNITEDERMVSQLGNRTTLLEETLTSHRFALSLNPSNTDILFNAGQVLTSLAEAQLQVGTQAAGKYEARPLLEEAVSLFTKCLESQQQQYTQMQIEIARAQASGEFQESWEGERQQPPETNEDEMDTVSSALGDWATIEEPLTPEVLLETCTAQLSALTTLLGLYIPAEDLHDIEKKVQDGSETATTRIPALIDLIDKSPATPHIEEPKAGPTLSIGSLSTEEVTTSPKDDAILSAANFQVGVAEVIYRSRRSTLAEYAQTVEQIFSSLSKTVEAATDQDLAAINVQSAYADALMDIASALADGPEYTASSPTFATNLDIQWTALTQVQTLLTRLSSPPQSSLLPPSRLANVFLARGDTDLFRYRISLFDGAKTTWVKSRPVLLANAGVFYRGARSYADRAGSVEVRSTADAKAIIAEILKDMAGNSGSPKTVKEEKHVAVMTALEQMVEEGVISREHGQAVMK